MSRWLFADVDYGGQFENVEEAMRTIVLLSVTVVVAIFAALWWWR